jgi:DNA-binding transcriptional MerR regulator
VDERTGDLRLAQLAELTGLTPQVIRAWESRYGFPVPGRSEGGHRRYSAEQAATLRRAAILVRSGFRPREAIRRSREQDAGEEPWPPAPPGDVTARRLIGILTAGSPGEALSYLRGLEAAMGFEPALEDAVLPALREVGELWGSGDLTVAEEHAASGIVLSWLGKVRSEAAPLPEFARPVLIAAAPGEQHALALFALEVLLVRRRLPALVLGADVPANALAAHVRRLAPRAVVLSISTVSYGESLAGSVRAVREADPAARVYVGGRGLGGRDVASAVRLPDRLTAAAQQLVAELA